MFRLFSSFAQLIISSDNLVMSIFVLSRFAKSLFLFRFSLFLFSGCWECYKIIMDLLRYAPKIDYLYHETAQKALEFCRVNKRIQEFRRLCDTLRQHYQLFQKRTWGIWNNRS